MSKVVTEYGDEHSSCRIYIFGVSYESENWLDDPQQLIIVLRDKLDRILNFSYKTIKICGLRKTLIKNIEIHIDGIEYEQSDRLNATQVDEIRFEIKSVLSEITNLTYGNVDVVADRFLDDPTQGFLNYSMSEA